MYSVEVQYAVLRAVKDQCGLHGERPISIVVDGVSDSDISPYIDLLQKLDFIEAVAFRDPQGTIYFPVSLTGKGLECLVQTDRDFWKKAQDAVVEGVKVLTGADVGKFADFFKAVYEKYQRERGPK